MTNSKSKLFIAFRLSILIVFFLASTHVSAVSATPVAAGAPPHTNTLPTNSPHTNMQALTTPELIAQDLAQGLISPEQQLLYLAYALSDYEKLPAQYRSNQPWDGTLPLLKLRRESGSIASVEVRQAVERATAGTCNSASAILPSVRETAHFHIEYGAIRGGLTIDSYVNSLEGAWGQEITQFGWAAPPAVTVNPLPGNRYYVSIEDLGGGLYGFVSSEGPYAGLVGDNPNTSWNDLDAYASCMALHDDYSEFGPPAQLSLDATVAHEFNHSIQFGLGVLEGANYPDESFIEGGATWMEDEVYDYANDNVQYLWPDFTLSMGEYVDFPYAYWITFRGLTERYGTGTPGGGEQIMQDFWEETSKSANSNQLAALNTALANKGSSLADAYHAYAIAARFVKPCGGAYIYPYCFEEAANYLAMAGSPLVQGKLVNVGESYSGSVRDNYALNWVDLPKTGGPYQVIMKNLSAGGQLRGSVVCDTGAALNVSPLPGVAGAGVSSVLQAFDPAGCNAVAMVVTNQSQTADNPSSSAARSYRVSVTSPGVSVKAPADLPAAAGGAVLHDFVIANLGSASDTYSLTYTSSQGWAVLSSLPVTLTLAAGADAHLQIPVNVPAGAAAGSAEETTLAAASTTNALSQSADSVIVTVQAAGNVTISGNAGIGGATLSYTDVTTKTATADAGGNYSFAVPYNWSGTVRPYFQYHLFTPAFITYTAVITDQVNQDYTAWALTFLPMAVK